MPKWSGVHHHKDGLGNPKNIEEDPTMVNSRRDAKNAKQYLLEDESNTTPSSRISEDARSKSTLLSEEKSPTSTENDAMNGRSTITKATTTRKTSQFTNSTATSTSTSTSEDVHWIPAIQGTPSFKESQCQLYEDKKKKVSKCQSDLRQDESSPVGQKLRRSRRTQDKSQEDSTRSRSPEDVPSKLDGSMDNKSRLRIGNRNFSRNRNSKINNIRSVCSHQEEEIKPTARTIQSRSLPSRSSTLGVKTTQVKQTVITRRSTRPERSVKRAWFRNLLMTVVEIRMISCEIILSNGYNSCVSRTQEVVVTSLNVTQRTDDEGNRWRMYKTNSRQRKVVRLQLDTSLDASRMLNSATQANQGKAYKM
ncbi:hypothetical protein B9Z55_019928 [Caenorhabditis nigoni]|uniref:Uncharacterized protein n=1 Tax=Caenorhabditis nigoni TaxID=1611254 RepID=A0A2G5TKL4_9PELO|nr:hypothetical protein B9Z55_019928 [Caenorhabditis nigoni]